MSSDEERVEAPLLEQEYLDRDSEKIRKTSSRISLRFLLLQLCLFVVNLLLLVILLRMPLRTTTCEPPMIYCETNSQSHASISILIQEQPLQEKQWNRKRKRYMRISNITASLTGNQIQRLISHGTPYSKVIALPLLWGNLQLTCALDANIRIHPDEIDQLGRTSVPISDDSGDFYGTLGRLHRIKWSSFMKKRLRSAGEKMSIISFIAW